MPNPLNDLELQQAKDQSWNPAVRRLLDWYAETQHQPQAAGGSAPPAAPSQLLPVPVISLRELRQLAGLTLPQISGLVRLAPERVEDIEALDLELLDVDQLLTYTTALGMALTITVDLMPGASRELISTRGKVTDLQREQAIAALKAGTAEQSATGLQQTDVKALEELQQVVEGEDEGEPLHDTQRPARRAALDTIDAEPDTAG